MKKRISIFLCVILVLATSIVMLASCGGVKAGDTKTTTIEGKYVGNNFINDDLISINARYYTDGGYIVLEGNKPSEMVISSSVGSIKELNIKKIQDKIKAENENIKVIGIKNSAFENCFDLETVDLTIKDEIDTFFIGGSAFKNCKNLKSVKLPNNVYTYGNIIDSNAFANCVKLESITNLEKFNSISTQAFANCESLKTIDLSTKTTFIADSTFDNCTNLTTVNNISGVKSIGESAFRNTSLTNVDFNAMTKLEVIEDSAFYGAKLTTVKLPDNIIVYHTSSFQNNPLTSVDVPFIGTFNNSLDDNVFNYFGYDYSISENGPDYVIPSFTLNIRKAITVLPGVFDGSLYDNKLTAVSITLVPNGVYTFKTVNNYSPNNITEATIKLTAQDKINITKVLYNYNEDITSFKVNGEEYYEAPAPAPAP